MGQYYVPVIISSRENPKVLAHFHSHLYGNGLKLMEHSYVGNVFVRAVETFLRMDGAARLVWAGDYADSENGTAQGPNLYDLSEDAPSVIFSEGLTARGYMADQVEQARASGKVIDLPLAQDDDCRYVLNMDRRLFVDTAESPREDATLRIHPLPLLTCEGNGRGGGDYRAEAEVIGSWARDRVTVSGQVPEGFEKLDFAALLPAER